MVDSPTIFAQPPPKRVKTLLGRLLTESGITQRALAKALQVTEGAVSQWVLGLRQIPAEQCVAIERYTGGKIKRKDLRPDLFGPLK